MAFGKQKERVPGNELLNRILGDKTLPCSNGSKNFSIVAYFTDRADFAASLDELNVSALLELRVFDTDSEFRAYRSIVNEAFICRLYRDSDFAKDEMMEEIQYLDIDGNNGIKPCDNGMYEYKTMNGGFYHLPISNAEKIKICNYLMYNEENMAQVYDYRFVEIIAKDGTENG